MGGAKSTIAFHRPPRGAQIGVWVLPAEQGSKLCGLPRRALCWMSVGMDLDRLVVNSIDVIPDPQILAGTKLSWARLSITGGHWREAT